jgi:hypothetical protein
MKMISQGNQCWSSIDEKENDKDILLQR